MRTFAAWAALAALAWVSPASAQSLPVMIESDDARDGLYESVTARLAALHAAERVPLTQMTVPCGQGSTSSPLSCVNGTFHQQYRNWVIGNPGIIEIGQHGTVHDEQLGTMPREQQLAIIRAGLQEMQTWGLPEGRPFSFALPFSSENPDTISVLEELGYHVSVKNAGSCPAAPTMERFCDSVSICERNATGGRVSGPTCVLRQPADVVAELLSRAAEGKAFINYHVQDMTLANGAVDEAKFAGFAGLLRALRAEEAVGRFDLMTMDAFYRSRHAVPPPTSQPPPPPPPPVAPPPPAAPPPPPADIGPDLAAQFLELSASCKKGKCTVNALLLTGNLGNERAGKTKVRFLLSADGAPSGDDVHLKDASLKRLSPGQFHRLKLKRKLPKGFDPSNRFVLAIVDPENRVAERREDNALAVAGPLPGLAVAPPPPAKHAKVSNGHDGGDRPGKSKGKSKKGKGKGKGKG